MIFDENFTVYGILFQPNACHISQTTLEALTPGRYKIKPRGTFEAKVSLIQNIYIYLFNSSLRMRIQMCVYI